MVTLRHHLRNGPGAAQLPQLVVNEPEVAEGPVAQEWQLLGHRRRQHLGRHVRRVRQVAARPVEVLRRVLQAEPRASLR